MKLITLIMMLISTSSFADHNSWSSTRGTWYANPYQFITASEVLHSEVSDLYETKNYKGVGLKTALGTEISRFMRFSGYHEYRDLRNNEIDSIRGSELGVDCKTSFSGPIVNLHLGIGLYALSMLHQDRDQATKYFGNGSSAIFGLERFLSDRSSVAFDIRATDEQMKSEIGESLLNGKTHGASMSLLLWFN